MSFRPRAGLTPALLALVAPLLVVSPARAQSYSVLDLEPYGGNAVFPYAINALGQITGSFNTGTGIQAFRTSPDTAVNPATDLLGDWNGGNYSIGYGINDQGQVVGYAVPPGGGYIPFRTAPDAALDPATDNLDPANPNGRPGFNAAYGINNAGQASGIVGSGQAFVTGPGQSITPASLLGGAHVAPALVNNQGQVAGTLSSPFSAFVAPPGQPLAPGDALMGGVYSEAEAFNNTGQVAGYFLSQAGNVHAFVSGPGGTLIDLGNLGMVPSQQSYAYGINDIGQVVGSSDTNTAESAFIWDPTNGMRDLNSLIPSGTGIGHLEYAYGINNRGQIIGIAGDGPAGGGLTRAFLLTPLAAVPEPSAVILLALGLPAAGLLARRRRARGG